MSTVATSILERNLDALSRSSPDVARRLAGILPRADVRVLPTEEGTPTIELGEGPTRRALASRRRPREEARVLTGQISIADAAVFLVSGFGAGYHVEALAQRLDRTGVIVVFEPDLPLLRAVLEHMDCSGWLASRNIAIVHDPGDTAALARLVEGIEALVAMGVTLVEHPPSRFRIGDGARRLHENFLEIVRAVRMTVVTTLVQVRTTLSNLTQNLDWYVQCPGVAGLAGACRGRAAIVVAAGPSLQRNIALLEDPRVRDRLAIIAVQTVLKPLLARGIRPHFITALDYSEISARFYEGLSPDDVRGITLVADPKVNPAVLKAWCSLGGECRLQGDKHLDKLLGPALARDRGYLPPGATVAHQAYYLARHLGCDPVALVGQDLGFTDGQYYASGAAIHGVWACELNEFNTLEMLEWQRILRMGQYLRRSTDILGRAIYTDQQMSTYLVQFERDFGADAARGLTTIDATEGGVRKQHTTVQTLRSFIDQHTPTADGEPISALLAAAARRGADAPVSVDGGPGAVRERLQRRVAELKRDVREIAESSRRAEILLAEMIEHHADQPRVNRLIGRLDRLRDRTVALQPAFDLVQTLNQAGAFNRLRADRALQVESNAGGLSPLERQRRQLERDRENVRLLAAAADDLGDLLAACAQMLNTGRRVTRPSSAADQRSGSVEVAARRADAIATVVPVFVDPGSLAAPFADGLNVIEQTIARIGAGATRSDPSAAASGPAGARHRIIVLSEDPAQIRALIRRHPPDCRIEFRPLPPGSGALPRRAGVRVARALARECWRGGIANQSVYDEILDPAALRDLARQCDLEALLLIGPDWCAVDPGLCDRVVERFATSPESVRFSFTQAPPGLCGCIVSRALLEDLADAEARAAAGAAQAEGSAAIGGGVFASIGGLLGYIPVTPIVDLINLPECVAVEASVRDLGRRFIADTPGGRRAIADHLRGAGDGGSAPPAAPAQPTHLVLHAASRAGGFLCPRAAQEALAAIDADEKPVVTIRSDDPESDADPLDHPELDAIVSAAQAAGAIVHLRTPLASSRFDPSMLLACGARIISVDVHGERAAEGLDRLAAKRRSCWAVPWIVPRLTRCDARYEAIDGFYRQRLLQCGWAVIDPLPAPRPGERIAPLPLPESARRRLARQTRVIGVDGSERGA